jgi:hypothetical protein
VVSLLGSRHPAVSECGRELCLIIVSVVQNSGINTEISIQHITQYKHPVYAQFTELGVAYLQDPMPSNEDAR